MYVCFKAYVVLIMFASSFYKSITYPNNDLPVPHDICIVCIKFCYRYSWRYVLSLMFPCKFGPLSILIFALPLSLFRNCNVLDVYVCPFQYVCRSGCILTFPITGV